jgi:hypothetical protein
MLKGAIGCRFLHRFAHSLLRTSKFIPLDIQPLQWRASLTLTEVIAIIKLRGGAVW